MNLTNEKKHASVAKLETNSQTKVKSYKEKNSQIIQLILKIITQIIKFIFDMRQKIKKIKG